MANLNKEEIKSLKRKELYGTVALAFCGAVCAYFIICFTIAQVHDNYVLRLTTLIIAPVLLLIGAGFSAFINVKFGGKLDRLIKTYVRDVFIENASLMRPERDSLTYTLSYDGCLAEIKVNNFKEKIIFDFSALGKLSAVRRAGITTAIIERLEATFCRLAERGGKYSSVTYCVIKSGSKAKSVSVIENGVPDKKAYKNYLKTK